MRRSIIIFFSLSLFLSTSIRSSDHGQLPPFSCKEELKCCGRCCRGLLCCLGKKGSILLCCLGYGVCTRPCRILTAAVESIGTWPSDFQKWRIEYNKLRAVEERMKR